MTVPKELIIFREQLERVVYGKENSNVLRYEGRYEREWLDRKVHAILGGDEAPAEVLDQVEKLIMWTKIK